MSNEATEYNPAEDPRRPTVKLIGFDGNAFSILGRVGRALDEAGYSKEEVNTYNTEAMSGDYNHLLRVSCNWANVPMDDEGEQS